MFFQTPFPSNFWFCLIDQTSSWAHLTAKEPREQLATLLLKQIQILLISEQIMVRQLVVSVIDYPKSKTKINTRDIYHCYYGLYMPQ